MKLHAPAALLLLLPLPWGPPEPLAPPQLASLTAEDVFGRTLGPKTPLQLVDGQGYLANPAIEFDLLVPAEHRRRGRPAQGVADRARGAPRHGPEHLPRS